MSVVKMFCSLLFPQAERVLVAGDIKHEIKKQMLNGSAWRSDNLNREYYIEGKLYLFIKVPCFVKKLMFIMSNAADLI